MVCVSIALVALLTEKSGTGNTPNSLIYDTPNIMKKRMKMKPCLVGLEKILHLRSQPSCENNGAMSDLTEKKLLN